MSSAAENAAMPGEIYPQAIPVPQSAWQAAAPPVPPARDAADASGAAHRCKSMRFRGHWCANIDDTVEQKRDAFILERTNNPVSLGLVACSRGLGRRRRPRPHDTAAAARCWEGGKAASEAGDRDWVAPQVAPPKTTRSRAAAEIQTCWRRSVRAACSSEA